MCVCVCVCVSVCVCVCVYMYMCICTYGALFVFVFRAPIAVTRGCSGFGLTRERRYTWGLLYIHLY